VVWGLGCRGVEAGGGLVEHCVVDAYTKVLKSSRDYINSIVIRLYT
jgi:hypothetical protein